MVTQVEPFKLKTYTEFLKELDKTLDTYFEKQSEFICCQKGCSSCCEKGDYPVSELELRYLMLGYSQLDNETKIKIQNNIKNVQKGEACPFLLNKTCSIYSHRPIICRVHGLAYLCKDNTAKVPYCTKEGKNFAKVYQKGELLIEPINENLDITYLATEYNLGEVRNLYDWIKS